jgi:carbon-monoxide dehydrogenase iron sulfur subunit
MTRARIVVDANKCYGCRVCEMVCSLRQSGLLDPNQSAINRNTLLPDLAFKPVVCLQCPSMPCAAVCPQDAITRDERTGAVVIDYDRCIQCGNCVDACPLGQLTIVSDRLVKCDLCGGDPLCVAWCPRGALSVVEYGSKAKKKEEPHQR